MQADFQHQRDAHKTALQAEQTSRPAAEATTAELRAATTQLRSKLATGQEVAEAMVSILTGPSFPKHELPSAVMCGCAIGCCRNI